MGLNQGRLVKDKIRLAERVGFLDKKPFLAGRLGSGLQSYLLAALPKSGSTWLTQMLSRLPMFREVSFVPSYGAREQELDCESVDFSLQRYCCYHTICQHHVKYNDHTRNCLLMYVTRPIILTRNIKDNLLSVTDHWKAGNLKPAYSYYIDESYFSNGTTSASIERKIPSPLEYATILHGPWILNFYLSWMKLTTRQARGLPKELSPIYLTYETLANSTYDCLYSLTERLGFSASEKELKNAMYVDNTKTRLNIGTIGRGEDAFAKDPAATSALEKILGLYPHEDLRGLGVNNDCH